MSRNHIVVGLDIGTSTVSTLVAQKREEMAIPQVIGVGVAPSMGMRRGAVADIEEVVKSIQRSVTEAARTAGVSIERVYAGVGGGHIVPVVSRGIVAVSRADQEISHEDVERVITAARAIALPQNREILHIFPREYIVDGEGDIKDAIGMRGVRLEVDTLIIGGASHYIHTLQRCVQEAGLETAGFVLNSYAATKAVLSKKQREFGVVCIDMGGGTTELAVFEEGDLLHVAVIPIGSGHITNDLAIGLRTSVETAEQIKKEYGLALAHMASKRDIIDLAKINPGEEGIILRKDAAEIIEARLRDIFDLVNKELRKIGKEAFLPGGAVLVGGGVKLPHIVDLAKEHLRLPVQIGFPRDIEGIIDSVDDPAFATALGLVFCGYEAEEEGGGTSMFDLPGMPKVFDGAKKWIRSLLP